MKSLLAVILFLLAFLLAGLCDGLEPRRAPMPVKPVSWCQVSIFLCPGLWPRLGSPTPTPAPALKNQPARMPVERVR